jgi:hypothetical protein
MIWALLRRRESLVKSIHFFTVAQVSVIEHVRERIQICLSVVQVFDFVNNL